ncbi:N-acetylneuraminate lyase [Paramuricea clavata]|uniref:N-acetylneuraminate lyase n=1 Tax=Paramuricea clavata TaxID=317549 RepID=A0A6S7JBM7_PARCT|nr:N-acetylneuraminate lyase [Paramuricea clavata]
MDFQLGLAAAPVTPLYKNGELINVSIIGKYIDILLEQGIRRVYVNGCTGEGPSFNVQERKLVAEKWLEYGRNKLDKIIIQIGGTNMKDSQELAVHAQSYTGVNIKVEEFLEAAQHKLPSLVGVKYSHNDLYDATQSTLVGGGKYFVSLGEDELLLSGLVLGIKSSIGSTYNYCGKVNCSIVEAYNKQDMDLARKLQLEAHQYLKIFMKYGGNAAAVTRAFFILLGLDVGPPRLPNKPLTNEELKLLKIDLQNAGFFDSK